MLLGRWNCGKYTLHEEIYTEYPIDRRFRGSDYTGNGVFSLLRGMCSPWFSYFKAFRGIAERVFLVFWSEF